MDVPEDLASGAQPLLGSPWQTDDVAARHQSEASGTMSSSPSSRQLGCFRHTDNKWTNWLLGIFLLPLWLAHPSWGSDNGHHGNALPGES